MNININEIDVEKLRSDLRDYYITMMYNVSPIAMMDIERVNKASNEELVEIAINNGFNLDVYKLKRRTY